MQIDPENLRRYYASLPDEELLALDRDDLTPVAQNCYDQELAYRHLTGDDSESPDMLDPGCFEATDGAMRLANRAGHQWQEEAACACVFPTAPHAAEACDVLRAAGIPCDVSKHEFDDEGRLQHEYHVMVPGVLNLHATSVLDIEIFNPKLEDAWSAHFEALSDDDLRALSAEVICAGLLDRVKRLKSAYNREIARRQSG